MNQRRAATLLLTTALAVPVMTLTQGARADDLADEADLHFRIGTEAYTNHDYRSALEHFLASNRLVPNRNVLFNVARAYEQLAQFANAHRYYTTALELERDPSRRTLINESLGRIRQYVAVLNVQTDPPGATVYINRRDLGPRGTTPRALAFPPGRYRVIAELDGYESAESQEVQATLGQETTVNLHLERIIGTLRIEGSNPGATVHIDAPEGEAACRIPCSLILAPGRHRVFTTLEGYATSEQDVDVVARSTVTARVRMQPLTGTLLVSTDERDALVEVDGRPMGFTPAVLNVQSGERRVRISLAGYSPITQTVTVRPNEQLRLTPELRPVQEVEAASRTAEAVEDAPSSVSVIPSQELRAMGYPTIAEAMRGIRGLYVSDDRFYPTVGFRGFSRLGDIGNRVLVLINGQPTNDNWGFFSFTGYDARVDLEDVERIEVVRGPGSVLYGTGAVSGVINVVTRGRDAPSGVSATASSVEGSISRGRVAGTVRLGDNAGLWTSVSGAYSPGRNFEFPELAGPGFDGVSAGADGFRALTVQGRGWWRDVSAQWLLNTRVKSFPFGLGGTSFSEPNTYNSDTRGLFELRYDPRLGSRAQLFSRVVFNHYSFIGTTVADPDMDGLRASTREEFIGNWLVAEARVAVTPAPWLRLMAGVEGQVHFTVNQRGEAGASGCTMMNSSACLPELYLPPRPANLPTTTRYYSTGTYDRHPFQIVAGYLLADLAFSPRVRLSAGVRQDVYLFAERTLFATSPRVSFIIRPYERGNLKIMAGRAFRAPSIYEQFYQNPNLAPSTAPYPMWNGVLQPETMWSGEIEFSHRFSSTWVGTLAAFGNYYTDFVSLSPTPDMTVQYRTSSEAPVLTVGGEAELRREWRQGWMFSASYSFQRSQYIESGGMSTRRHVPNSPEHLASLRGAMPILGRALTLGTRLSFEGPRWDRNDIASDPTPQQQTDPALVWDIVLSGQEQRAGLRYALGVYNILDWRYSVPTATGIFPASQIAQNGRTLLLSVGLNI
jgi:outer membrane receptor protein involved in Fe transport